MEGVDTTILFPFKLGGLYGVSNHGNTVARAASQRHSYTRGSLQSSTDVGGGRVVLPVFVILVSGLR